MYEKARDTKFYADLARESRAPAVSETLSKLSLEKAAQLRRLQAEYFILTGETVNPCVAYLPLPPSFADALRARHLSERESAAGFLSAAENADARLADVFREIAADDTRHANENAQLLSAYLCAEPL